MTAIEDLYWHRYSVWSDIQGHMPTLYGLAAETDVSVVVELGVRTAVSTTALLWGVERNGGSVISVDTRLVAKSAFLPIRQAVGAKWRMLVGDDLTDYILRQIPERIDLCFIDTSHTLAQTRAELAVYGPRSKVLALHDVELERPDASPPDDPPFPVRVAVEEYVATSGRTVEYRTGSYGLAIVR